MVERRAALAHAYTVCVNSLLPVYPSHSIACCTCIIASILYRPTVANAIVPHVFPFVFTTALMIAWRQYGTDMRRGKSNGQSKAIERVALFCFFFHFFFLSFSLYGKVY